MVLRQNKKLNREWGDGRRAFCVHAQEIFTEIHQRRRSQRSVWREFKERLGGLSYQQFAKYVQRAEGAGVLPAPAATPQRTKPAAPAMSPRGAGAAPESPNATFHFDPLDAYRKKFV